MIDFALGEEENTSPTECRGLMAEASSSSACAPRYRCGFPGCNKRYASTDGVRKHARKTHTQWLKDVDEQSSLRDHKLYGNKPSTYCTMEAPEGGSPQAAAGSSQMPPAMLPEQLLQQFLARYQPGGNPAVAGGLLGGAPEAPAGLAALTPSSMLLAPPDGAGCKRDAGSLCAPLLDPHEVTKRLRCPSLWGARSEEEPGLLDAVDDSSSSLSSSPRAPADYNLTPLTVPLPRPLSGSGEVSPFRLDKSGGEEALMPQPTGLELAPLCRSDSSQFSQVASCDDFLSFTMDDDECAAFLKTILA